MDAPALPPRLAWFAPWRWFSGVKPLPRYTLLMVVLAAVYVESPIPVSFIEEHFGVLSQFPYYYTVKEVVYAPLQWAYDTCDVVKWFYEPQFKLLDWLDG